MMMMKVLSSVLEEMAFLSIDPEEEAEPFGELPLAVANTIRGERQGTVLLRTVPGFARMLAANLLGMEEDDPTIDESGIAALKEFMNVICGHLVTELYGEEAETSIAIPQRVNAPPNAPPPAAAESVARVHIESFPVEISLTYQRAS